MGEPRVSACPEAVNTFAQAERELWPVSQHKLQRINAQEWQGKLSCLQLFPPFIYLFFFTVLNITSLSLLVEAKCFQCLGLHFRLSKELLRGKRLSPDCWTLGRSFSGQGEEAAGLPLKQVSGAVLPAPSSSPGNVRVAGHRQSQMSTSWTLLRASR